MIESSNSSKVLNNRHVLNWKYSSTVGVFYCFFKPGQVIFIETQDTYTFQLNKAFNPSRVVTHYLPKEKFCMETICEVFNSLEKQNALAKAG